MHHRAFGTFGDDPQPMQQGGLADPTRTVDEQHPLRSVTGQRRLERRQFLLAPDEGRYPSVIERRGEIPPCGWLSAGFHGGPSLPPQGLGRSIGARTRPASDHQPRRVPPPAPIIWVGADERCGFGTGVTEVDKFVRANRRRSWLSLRSLPPPHVLFHIRPRVATGLDNPQADEMGTASDRHQLQIIVSQRGPVLLLAGCRRFGDLACSCTTIVRQG